nr:MAG TPA: hypothetical protein [Caudoviricetes sp.]
MKHPGDRRTEKKNQEPKLSVLFHRETRFNPRGVAALTRSC